MEVFIPIWTKTQTGPFLILVCSSISKQNSTLDSGSGKGWLEYWNTWSLSLCVRPLHVHIFWLFPVSLQHRKDIPLGLDHTQSQHINVPCDFCIYPKDLNSNFQRICMNSTYLYRSLYQKMAIKPLLEQGSFFWLLLNCTELHSTCGETKPKKKRDNTITFSLTCDTTGVRGLSLD